MKSPAAYWSDHILKWENKNYSAFSLLNPFSTFIRNRQKQSIKILQENIFENCRVLEVGCGSGILINRARLKAQISYIGIDISKSAISLAERRNYSNNIQTRFIEGDLRTVCLPACDIAIVLGMSDWLTEKELRGFLYSLDCKLLIFSYTRKNNLAAVKMFNLYHNFFSSKMQKEGFPKQYFTPEIRGILNEATFEISKVYKNVFKYSLGVLVVAKKSSNGQ